jgi:hypothetical protein
LSKCQFVRAAKGAQARRRRNAGLVRRAGAGVEVEAAAPVRQLFGHGEQRGDADAARDQQAVATFRQRKQIARRTDAQPVARAQVCMDAARAAAPVGLQQHRNFVGAAILRAVAQRIGTDLPVWQLDLDMGAG